MVTRHSSPTHRATRRDLKMVSKLGGASLIVIAALAMSANTAQAQTEDVVCADAATGAPIASQQAAAALASGVQVICGAGAQATGDGAIAVGKNAKATGQSDSIAIGTDSEATGVSAVAVGDTAKALGARTVAIGNNARAGRGPNEGAGAVAVGNGAQALTNGTVSVGQNAGGGATNAGTSRVAIGDNAGTNVDGNTNTAVGAQSGQTIKGVNNTALGYQAGRNVHGIISLVNGMNNTAIGTRSGNVVSGSRNTTVGWEAGSNVTGFDNVSFGGQSGINVQGRQNTANGYYAGSGIQGSYNVASGTAAGANVTGSYNIALGDHAGTLTRVTVASDGQPDFSSSDRLTVSDSIALGRETQVGGDNAMALGSLANATLANSVALGANALADTVIGTASGTIAGTTYNYAGSVPLSTVSIGKAGEERTITNLAAGRVDATSTDAVNGSQLAATNAALDEAAAAADNSVQYDDPDKASVTLGGVASTDGGVSNGTKITNVAQGNVADGSTDAVNGTQLYQVQQQMLAGQTHYVSINDNGTQGANYNNDGAVARNSMAIGVGASATGYAEEGVAMGPNAAVKGWRSVAIGNQAIANGSEGIAIGNSAISNGGVSIGANTATGIMAVSIGNNAGEQASGNGNTSVGWYAGRFITGHFNSVFGTSAGQNVTGTSNSIFGLHAGEKLTGSRNVSLGNYAMTEATGSENIAIGSRSSTGIIGDHNMALGYMANNRTEGDHNIALGMSAGGYSFGDNNSAIGYQAGFGTIGDQNIAYGFSAGYLNRGSNNVLMGTQAGSRGDLNDPAALQLTTANEVIAIGQNSFANQDTAVAIGKDATANASVGDVALGAGSVTDLAVGTASGTIAGITYNYAGTNPLSTVSVGAVGAERTVTNVAAGRVSASSTDAINGSQLAATNDAVEDAILQAQGNTAALGGGAAYDPATSLYTAPSYVTSTGTYNNVGDALVAGNNQTNALGNSVASGLGGTSSYDPVTGQVTTGLNVGGTDYSDVNSALNAVSTQASAGWNVTTGAVGSGIVNGSSLANVAPGATHTITAGDNIVATQNGTEVQLAVNPDLKVTSVTTGNTVMDNDGVTVSGGANGPVSLTGNGLDNGGNTITNVAAGVNDTDAVNVSQLAAATTAGANADERAVKYDWTDLDGDGVVDPGEVDYSKVTLAGATGTTIDNLAPGTIDASSMQAVNGSQIHANQQSLANALGGGSVVNADGTLSAPSYVTSTGTYNNVGDALIAGNNQINLLGNSVASGLGGTSSYDQTTGQLTTALTVGGVNYSDVNSALNAVGAQAGAGWTVTTDASGTGESVATLGDYTVEPGENLGITAGNNMIITQDGTDLEFAVNPNLKITSVTTGNTVMNNDGVTVNGGANGPVSLTNNGLNNGGNIITNVAAGVNDTDAVNVSQLAAATTAGTNADERAVKYDWTDLDGDGVVDPGEVDYSKATLAGVGGTTIDNLAPGTIDATSMQAVNGSQIHANQQSLANALGAGSVVNADGTLGAPSYVTSTGTYNNVGDALVAGNNQTNALGNSVASGLGGTSSYDPVTGQVTTGLSVGGTNYSDVNSALNAVSTQASAGWNVTTGAVGSGIVNGSSLANVAPGATHTITAGDNIVATQNGTEVQLAVNPDLNVTSVTTGNTVMDNDGVTVSGGANGPVSLTGNGLDNGGNTISNVAAGVNDTDAVNVAQLNQTNQQVTDLSNRTDALGESVASGLGGNSSYDPVTGQVTTDLNVGGTSYTDVNSAINAINATANAGWNIQANGGASSNIATNGTLNVTQGSNTQVTLQGNELQVAVVDNPTFSGMVTANGGLTVGAGQTVDMGGNVVTNVGAGAVNATSTDAVNGSQLYAASVAAQNSVQYDEGHTSVTFNPGGDAIQLHNVAAGTAPTDAVNVAQLNAGMNDAVARANSYTDSRIMMLEYDLGNARRDANAGTAGALAAAGLPQAYEPGKGMIAGGVGYYDGQTAFAIGGSRVSDDGRIIVKAGATYNTRGRAGANVGVGYQF